MNTMPFVYFREQIIAAEEAKISIASNSLQYGTTCFAGIRGYYCMNKIRVFRLEDHYQRLMNASKIMGMSFFITFEKFQTIIGELIAKNKPITDFYIRPFLFSQDQQLAPKPTGLQFELAIYFVPLGHYFDPSKGMRLMISSWRKFSDTALPTKAKAGGCYINSFLATADALRCGYDEALLLNEEGHVVEASVANILVHYRNRVLMPQLGSGLLEGMTMRTVIELLQEEGISVHFEKIDRSMIYGCDELLLMGTAAQVSFAESVDGRTMGSLFSPDTKMAPGPLCQLLREKFHSIITNNHPKSQKWILEF